MSGTSNGSVSTLRGHCSKLPDAAMCDDHPDRPAVSRIQGETNSFGCEYHDLCQECIDEIKKSIADDKHGCCDWCGNWAADLRNRRYFEEGLAGRVYRVCGACVKSENARLNE